MAEFFKMPKIEKPRNPPDVQDAFLAAAEQRQSLAKRSGRASTILGGSAAQPATTSPATKALLGQ